MWTQKKSDPCGRSVGLCAACTIRGALTLLLAVAFPIFSTFSSLLTCYRAEKFLGILLQCDKRDGFFQERFTVCDIDHVEHATV
jgi:hypothetical protein